MSPLTLHDGEESTLHLLSTQTTNTVALPRTNDITTGIFDTPTKWSRRAPYVAIFVQLFIIAFLILIIPYDIWLSNVGNSYEGSLSTVQKTVYATGIVIVASLAASFTAGQVRSLWLNDIFIGQAGPGALHDMHAKRARVLLRIGDIKDTFKYFNVTLSLVIVGLVTAAIVGGTAGTVVGFPVDSVLRFPFDILDTGYGCFSYESTRNALTPSWQISDNLFYTLNRSASNGFCPTDIALVLVSNVLSVSSTTMDPPDGCITFGGGRLACSALGAPYTSNMNCGLGWLWTLCPTKAEDLSNMIGGTACVPSIVSNPVRCYALDQVDDLNGCTTPGNGTTSGLTLQRTNSSSVGMCTAGMGIGEASFVIVTTDKTIIGLMMELVYADTTTVPVVYGIECDVAFAPTLEFQTVELSPRSSYIGGAQTVQRPLLKGTGKQCNPLLYGDLVNTTQLRGNFILSLGVSILFSLFQESNLDDLGDTLFWTGWAGTWGAFSNSVNSIEDHLGLYLSLGVGLSWPLFLQSPNTMDQDSNDSAIENSYGLQTTLFAPRERIGSGSWIASLYILPSVFTVALLGFFLVRKRLMMATASADTPLLPYGAQEGVVGAIENVLLFDHINGRYKQSVAG